MELSEHQRDILREGCTDNFEGIPCTYPRCLCNPEYKRILEEWAKHVTSPEYNGTY